MLSDEEIGALKKPKIDDNLTENDHAVIDGFFNYFLQNLEVWLAVQSITKEMVFKGVKKSGIVVVFGRIRYDYTIKTKSDKFKLSNNYMPFYAYAFAEKYPSFAFIFDYKKSRAKCVDYDLLFNYLADKNNNKKESYV